MSVVSALLPHSWKDMRLILPAVVVTAALSYPTSGFVARLIYAVETVEPLEEAVRRIPGALCRAELEACMARAQDWIDGCRRDAKDLETLQGCVGSYMNRNAECLKTECEKAEQEWKEGG